MTFYQELAWGAGGRVMGRSGIGARLYKNIAFTSRAQ